jgi:hypothetical protein
MHPQDWESLFIVALSHGDFLSSRQVNKFWFAQFVRSTLGLDELSAHKTGITALFLELIWQRRKHDGTSSPDDEADADAAGQSTQEDDGSTQTCTFDEFVRMMEKLSIRCHQSLRASELLHRFNERAAITSTAPQSMSISAALSHMTRYYFAKACEQSFVSRDSVVMLDPAKSTVSYVGRLVLGHLFASLMDSVVMPVFLRFGACGRMTMPQYIAFVAYVFQGRKAPNDNHVRAVFCQVNRNEDLAGVLDATTSAHPPRVSPAAYVQEGKRSQRKQVKVLASHVPTLELLEFLDALCLLGVVMFSNEVTYKHLRTVEGKVWAFMEQLCQIEGTPMCSSASSNERLRRLEPRLSLVYPPALPVQTATSFVVSGLCLDHAVTPVQDDNSSSAADAPLSGLAPSQAELNQFPLSARTSIDTKQSHGQHNRVTRTATQQRMLYTPSTKELPVNSAVMLQSRTRSNVVAQLSSSLFTGQFEVATARTVANRAPHKPLHERVGLRISTMADLYNENSSASGHGSGERDDHGGMRSPGSTSTLSVESRPSTGRNKGSAVPNLAGTGEESPAPFHASFHMKDEAQHPLGQSLSSMALRREVSPQPTVGPPLQQLGGAASSPPVFFAVDGHQVQQVNSLPSQRLKLQLPAEALLPAAQYTAYCTFHFSSSSSANSVNPEDSSSSMCTSIVCTLRRERIATVSVHSEGGVCAATAFNSQPLTLKLKPIRQVFTPALQMVLEEHFEASAPSGRMDRTQFLVAIQTLKNCVKEPSPSTDQAFELFSSVTNSECHARLSAAGDCVTVAWDAEGATLPGPPRLSFLGFLHAVAYVYLDVEKESAKYTNTAPSESHSKLHPYRVPNMQSSFEQAFDESRLQRHTSHQVSKDGPHAARSPERRRHLDELVDHRDHTTYPSWDQRTQAPFDRALKWRAYNKRDNEAVADSMREDFKRLLASEAPAPNFIPNNPTETLLSAVAATSLRAFASDVESDIYRDSQTTATSPPYELLSTKPQQSEMNGATAVGGVVHEAPTPSTTKALAEVLSRTSVRDAQISFEARSQSMKLEYFEVAMIRTLSNRSRF